MPDVIGFHACRREFADELASGALSISDWRFSSNQYDWLGDGIYFWEGGFRRAVDWAHDVVTGDRAVIEAKIDLGTCFDLTNSAYVELLPEVYQSLRELYAEQGWDLPKNSEVSRRRGVKQKVLNILDAVNGTFYAGLVGIKFQREQFRPLRYLDSLVVNQFLNLMESGLGDETIEFQTVRSPFEEGEPLFPGSGLKRQTHTQISVRDRNCISSLKFHYL